MPRIYIATASLMSVQSSTCTLKFIFIMLTNICMGLLASISYFWMQQPRAYIGTATNMITNLVYSLAFLVSIMYLYARIRVRIVYWHITIIRKIWVVMVYVRKMTSIEVLTISIRCNRSIVTISTPESIVTISTSTKIMVLPSSMGIVVMTLVKR